ncbi:MAG: PQQ-dependent sugar dehydrogenase [Gammaproteobacteria bacterium]|nr:PQQ-dependent sugar dehydrogenase [Gammaproteobacteria bacterium]
MNLEKKIGVAIETLLLSLILGGCSGGDSASDDAVSDIPGVVSDMPGLDNRPNNLTCIAPPRPNSDASVAVIDPYPGLKPIVQPTKILLEPVADPRWFVLQKTGQLVTFDPDNAIDPDPFIDLSSLVRTDDEGGLLGMAFHPDYPNTPEIFLSYTVGHTGPPMRSFVTRFILDDIETPGAGVVGQVILEIDQDFDTHNGGDIAFGPDGYLYIGLGDGGSGGDPNNRAQDTGYLLGSMLRIDVLDPGLVFPTNSYAIPTDNPFAGNSKCGPGMNADPCPEIYAWGLRNPWRWSFDTASGELWLGDVGQSAYEEVNVIERGGNYGWRCREGAHDFNIAGCGSGLIDPVFEYEHNPDASITGGTVYRGSAIASLVGRYVFGDFVTGQIWALQSDGAGGYTGDELIDTDFGPTSFGADQNGELFFTDINNGRIRMLVPPGPSVPDTIPDLLSASGCTDPADVTKPYSGLLPYDINAPFWSDGAVKERFIGLPNGAAITRNVDGDWDFPNGTVIVKNFRLNGKLVETRHLMRHPDGVWAGYTYEWNSAQTEAVRVRGGKIVPTNGQDWIFPSASQCLACHTSAAGHSLGLETAQLNRDFIYRSTGRIANQLETIEHILMFTSPLPTSVQDLPAMPSQELTVTGLDVRARAYLHTNCAQCHRPGGPTPSSMDLRYATLLSNTNACDVIPLEGDLGIVNARLIAPGNAPASLIIARATRRDSHGMPPLGSNRIDYAGVTLLTAWINGLTGCSP